jgi:hypothetical protein
VGLFDAAEVMGLAPVPWVFMYQGGSTRSGRGYKPKRSRAGRRLRRAASEKNVIGGLIISVRNLTTTSSKYSTPPNYSVREFSC